MTHDKLSTIHASERFDQAEFDVTCEWGAQGVARLAPGSDVVVIVDVLSFCTAVEIAASRGAQVFPFRGDDESAASFAAARGATLASRTRRGAGYSLSPAALLPIAAGTQLVLPSPNGSTLTLATGTTPTLAGCLRNARAVAEAAQRYGRRVAVIAAGERWRDDGSLRPAFEDLAGAGAIIAHLPPRRSPEARLAAAVYEDARPDLARLIRDCASGQELVQGGFEEDVALASALNVSACVPVFVDGAYSAART